MAAFARYFATAGQVAHTHEHTPPLLLSLRESRMREILGLHTKVTRDIPRAPM